MAGVNNVWRVALQNKLCAVGKSPFRTNCNFVPWLQIRVILPFPCWGSGKMTYGINGET
jgi:hypothetical protein